MRVMLTGGTGFIGSALIQKLNEEGHEIKCISRNKVDDERVKYIKGDIMKPKSYENELIDFNPNKVIHLAWHGLPNYSEENCKLNYDATVELFKVVKQTESEEVICTGSCWEYKDAQGKVKENGKLDISNSFSFYKNKIRVEGNNIFRESNVDFTWVRPFFIYGAKQRKSSLIPSCYEAIKENKMPDIRNPDAINDYIHIEDVVNAISCLVNSEKNNSIYNIGSGIGTPVWEIVNIVALHCIDKRIYEDRNLKGQGNFADNSELRLKGWKPTISVDNGIKRVLEDFMSHEY